MKKPTLYIFSGLPASGKSNLGAGTNPENRRGFHPNRDYHSWDDDRSLIDTAGRKVSESVDELMDKLEIQSLAR